MKARIIKRIAAGATAATVAISSSAVYAVGDNPKYTDGGKTYSIKNILTDYTIMSFGDANLGGHMNGAVAVQGTLTGGNGYDRRIAPVYAGTIAEGTSFSQHPLSNDTPHSNSEVYYKTEGVTGTQLSEDYIDFAAAKSAVNAEIAGWAEENAVNLGDYSTYGGTHTINLSTIGGKKNIVVPWSKLIGESAIHQINFTGIEDWNELLTGGYNLIITGAEDAEQLELSWGDYAWQGNYLKLTVNGQGCTLGKAESTKGGTNFAVVVPNAPKLTIQVTQGTTYGHIIAPDSNVTGLGNTQGGFIVNNIDGNNEMHSWPYLNIENENINYETGTPIDPVVKKWKVDVVADEGVASKSDNAAEVEDNGTYSFSYTLKEGYEIVSVRDEEGNDVDPGDITVTKDKTITIVTQKIQHTVTFEKPDDVIVKKDTTPVTEEKVEHGNDVSYTVEIPEGKTVTIKVPGEDDIVVNGDEESTKTITIDNVTEDKKIVITEKENPKPVTYKVTVTGDDGVTEKSEDNDKVPDKGEYTLTFKVDDNHELTEVTLNGTSIKDDVTDNGDGTYTYKTTNITEDKAFVITTKEKEPEVVTHKVTVTGDDGVTEKSDDNGKVPDNGSYDLTFKVGENKELDKVTVDGEEVTPTKNEDGTYTYTVENITKDTEIDIKTKDKEPEIVTHKVTVTGDDGVTEKSDDNDKVPNKGSYDLTFKVDENKELDKVTVDGTEVTPTKNEDGTYTYTVENITKDTEIDIKTKDKEPEIVTHKVTVIGDEGVAEKSDDNGKVPNKGEYTLTFKVDDNHELTDVTLNGTSIKDDVTDNGDGTYTYKTTNITEDKNFVITTEEKKGSESSETKPSEPSDTEPSEPSDTEPSDTEPSKPSDTEPSEPSDTEPSEPSDTEPSEPSDTEPSKPSDTEEPSKPSDTEAPSDTEEPSDTTTDSDDVAGGDDSGNIGDDSGDDGDDGDDDDDNSGDDGDDGDVEDDDSGNGNDDIATAPGTTAETTTTGGNAGDNSNASTGMAGYASISVAALLTAAAAIYIGKKKYQDKD